MTTVTHLPLNLEFNNPILLLSFSCAGLRPCLILSIEKPHVVKPRLCFGPEAPKHKECFVICQEVGGVVPPGGRARPGDFDLAPVELFGVAHVELINVIGGLRRAGRLTPAKEVNKGGGRGGGKGVTGALLGKLTDTLGLLPYHFRSLLLHVGGVKMRPVGKGG